MTHYKSFAKPAVSVACVAFFLMGSTWTMLSVIGNFLIRSSNFLLSPSEYATLGFTLMGAAIFSSWMTGLIGHGQGMKKLILFSLASLIITNLSYSILSSSNDHYVFHWLVIAQIFSGISIGGLITSFSSYIPLIIYNKTPIVLSGIYSCTNLGSLILPLVFNRLISYSDLWMVNISICVIAFFLLIFGMYKLPHQLNPDAYFGSFEGFRKIPLRYWIFFTLAFSYGFIENTISSWGNIYLHHVSKIDLNTSNLGLSIFWGVVAISQLAICYLMQWIRPGVIYRMLPVLIIFGYYGLFNSKNYPSGILFFILSGVGCSAFLALSMSFVEDRFRSFAGLVTGCMVIGYFMGGAFCGLFFSVILKGLSLNQIPFSIAGTFTLLIMILVQKSMNMSE